MSMFKKKQFQGLFISSGCVILCVAACLPLIAQSSVSSDSELTSLLAARRDALTARVEIIDKLVARSTKTTEELFAAREELLDAEIEIATTVSERIEVLERKLENAKQFELVMQQWKIAARGTDAEILKAKADRIGVEIDLVREKQKRGGSK
ncbi:hypothetical protein VN12_25370 [Pirellula sp. SH-Sr6A]|uniref:hypothetical protein n=1 Tax=Pirellula sp. SH-Sr6A TaxID=1632865 RepID=UPI00078BA566|nr:hypothetical protein [Pirellula sp. SH-Sr6A]AMV35446.1 hypothetical protein VN12_25370 [Pirellula sp. SH-Sr6A]